MIELISKKVAIDTAIEAVDDWDGGCNLDREKYIREAFEALPSAQPEPCEEREKGVCPYYAG